MRHSNPPLLLPTAVVMALALAGCSSVETFLAGDKVDYRSQSVKTAPLEVPPDLTQLQRDGRYAPAAGSVSASAYQAGAASGVVLAATNERALEIVPLEVLRAHAVDVPADPSSLE